MRSETRAGLLAAKLRALVGSHFGTAERSAVDFPGGAGLVAGDTAWLLVDADPLKSFGPALVWSARQGASQVHLLVDAMSDVLARRAACFAAPPTVWRIDGTTLVAAEPAAPAAIRGALSAPELVQLLIDTDLEVIVEDGLVRGEVNGLEVARIVHGETSTGIPIETPLLEVGVGHADREFTAMLHGALSPIDQLARVAAIVREHRQPGAQRHPLNQLAPERWLRARLVVDPARVGLARLWPIDPAVARPNLRDPAVAMAQGESAAGEPVIVACSVGIDLDLVPAAADARLATAPAARLLLVMPERDAHSVTRELAGLLVHPGELIPVDDDWRC